MMDAATEKFADYTAALADSIDSILGDDTVTKKMDMIDESGREFADAVKSDIPAHVRDIAAAIEIAAEMAVAKSAGVSTPAELRAEARRKLKLRALAQQAAQQARVKIKAGIFGDETDTTKGDNAMEPEFERIEKLIKSGEMPGKDAIYDGLSALAKREARAGETFEGAFARVVESDPLGQRLYKGYRNAAPHERIGGAVEVKKSDPEATAGYSQLMAKAADLRKSDPKLTIEQAFERVYTDPVNKIDRRHSQVRTYFTRGMNLGGACVFWAHGCGCRLFFEVFRSRFEGGW